MLTAAALGLAFGFVGVLLLIFLLGVYVGERMNDRRLAVVDDAAVRKVVPLQRRRGAS